MPVDIHTLEAVDGSKNLRTDRVLIGVLVGVAYAGGTGTVATAITGLSLPVDSSGNALYGVLAVGSTGAFASVSAKTATGFTVTMNAGTVSAGTMDIFIYA